MMTGYEEMEDEGGAAESAPAGGRQA
jgi:hypothetical protein